MQMTNRQTYFGAIKSHHSLCESVVVIVVVVIVVVVIVVVAIIVFVVVTTDFIYILKNKIIEFKKV